MPAKPMFMSSFPTFPGSKTAIASVVSCCTHLDACHMPMYAIVVGLVSYACSVDFLASFFSIFSACVLSVVYLRRRRVQEKVLPEPRKADIPVERKIQPKKSRKKPNTKKKRNRGSACHSSKFSANENTPDQSEGQAKAETAEEMDKKLRKKNKNTVSRPLTETSSNQNKSVKFYSPLPLFVKLELDPAELYNRLYPYVLYTEQLLECGFPLNNPSQSGYGYCNVPLGDAQWQIEPKSRSCSRCGDLFSVSEDGLYEAESTCFYHSGKRWSVDGSIGSYSCCGQSFNAKGCTYCKHHVSSHGVLNGVKFVKTRNKRQSSALSKVYALDCEMCYTIQGLEVTRISVVGSDGLTVYDSYVLPENPVIDYNTQYSGITASDLVGVKTTLADVQAFLLKLLTAKTILVGHGLENDLRALRLIHETIIDTTVVFPHYNGPPFKRSLRSLAASFLKQNIQQGCSGHDSVEDARTCIELMLWKVQTDSHLFVRSPGVFPIGLSHHHQQQWPGTSLSINPTFVPYSVGYWVPPVGSSCELY